MSKRKASDIREFTIGKRARRHGPIPSSDRSNVRDIIMNYVDDVDNLIDLKQQVRDKFRVTSRVYTGGNDPELKWRYLNRTIPSLSDDVKIKLKVYLCLNPDYILPENITMDMIIELTSSIDILTTESRIINKEHINVLHPRCPLSQLRTNGLPPELYLNPKQIGTREMPEYNIRFVYYSFA